MNNKLLNNMVCAITFFSLTGIASAASAESDVDRLFNEQFNEQKTHIPSEYILSEMYTLVNPKSTSQNPGAENSVQNRNNNHTETTDNFEWIPADWHTAY